MKELSLHILDIAQNSIKAKATEVQITVMESLRQNWVEIQIRDNGCGMEPAFLEQVTDPFITTRTTRKIGLGLPLLKLSAESAGGKFAISSKVGVGTLVVAGFQLDHLNRVPIGDISSTMVSLLQANEGIRFIYCHQTDQGTFVLDTEELHAQLGAVPLFAPAVLSWVRDYINENLEEIQGGKI